MLAVRLGPVLRDRGEAADPVAACMRGDAPARVKDLDRAAGEADLDGFASERVGHAVAVAGDLDMVVDVHARLAPLAETVGSSGQRQQHGTLQRIEERAPASFQLRPEERRVGKAWSSRGGWVHRK